MLFLLPSSSSCRFSGVKVKIGFMLEVLENDKAEDEAFNLSLVSTLPAALLLTLLILVEKESLLLPVVLELLVAEGGGGCKRLYSIVLVMKPAF